MATYFAARGDLAAIPPLEILGVAEVITVFVAADYGYDERLVVVGGACILVCGATITLVVFRAAAVHASQVRNSGAGNDGWSV